MTEIIHKEHFEHWLFSQADERRFNFVDTDACLGCAFIRETTNFPLKMFGVSRLYSKNSSTIPHPLWFIQLLDHATKGTTMTFVNGRNEALFTIADTKAAWLKLFPETEANIQPAQAVKEVK